MRRLLLIGALFMPAVPAAQAGLILSGETFCTISLSPSQDFLRSSCNASLSRFEDPGACVCHGTLSPDNSMKVAVGYCNELCYQRFNYCQYRDEPHDRCARRLVRCLANC